MFIRDISSMKIRFAKTEDFKNYFRLRRELYGSELRTSKRDAYLKIYLQKPKEKEVRREFGRMLKKPRHIFLVAEDEERITGFQYGFVNYYKVDGRKNYFGYLDTLVVSNNYRGRGVGTRLIQEAIRWFKRRGLGWAVLQVDDKNDAAVRLYKKISFYPTELKMVKRI